MNRKTAITGISAALISISVLKHSPDAGDPPRPGDFRDAVISGPGESERSAEFNTEIPDIKKTSEDLQVPLPGAVPARQQDSFAVPYRITGRVVNENGVLLFSVADGRVFKLLPANRGIYKKAVQHAQAGVPVTLDGWARRLDDLAVIRADAFSGYLPDIPRSWRDKTQREPELVPGSGAFTVKNIRWGKLSGEDAYDWRTAAIDPELVDRVYILQKPFPPEFIASHAAMLFTFKAGGLADSGGNLSHGLILSVEAMLRPDKPVDLVSSLNKEFNILWLLTTEEDYIKFTCGTEKKKLLPHELLLSAAQKKALLKDALAQAVVNRSGEYFHTLTNNCTITLIHLLNKVLPAKARIRLFYNPSLYNPEAAVPNIAFGGLVRNGIAAPHTPEITPANYKDVTLWPR